MTRESPRTIHHTRPRFGKLKRGFPIVSPSRLAIGTRVEKWRPLFSKLLWPMAKENLSSMDVTCHPFLTDRCFYSIRAVST